MMKKSKETFQETLNYMSFRHTYYKLLRDIRLSLQKDHEERQDKRSVARKLFDSGKITKEEALEMYKKRDQHYRVF